MTSIRDRIKQIPLIEPYVDRRNIRRWFRSGRPLPAPHQVKQLAITTKAVEFDLDVLVETGTYLGDTIWSQKDYFKRIYSIELSPELHARAARRFSNEAHIKLLQGDSSARLSDVLKSLEGPALFWLDGHYSGGPTAKGDKNCPIWAELEQIFSHGGENVIMIDDARLFDGTDDYPTLNELSDHVLSNGDYEVSVATDIIFLTPARKKNG